jgi:hypothetical protein
MLVLSVVFFSCSTALHFTHKESLQQFFISLLALIPVSTVVQFAVKDITLSLQIQKRELLAGLFSGILGYCSLIVVRLEEADKEVATAPNCVLH